MPADTTSLPVEFLFSMHLDLEPNRVMMPNGPHGMRVFVPVLGGTVTGPKITGNLHPNSGGDWVHARADGVAQLDVRLTMVTDDGAVIAMEYRGVLGKDRVPRVAPLFQTGDERYLWLNNIQGVGIGVSGKHTVDYDFYALQ
jgi:Protein of unknown function (DUF3237)